MIAKMFYPIGWLAPVIVTAKKFMQSLWLLKCGWNDVLPREYSIHWASFDIKLGALSQLQIPRWIGLAKHDKRLEIHGFADASMKAYSAVLYLRKIKEDKIIINFQCAKTQVAPVKTVSIPRLELCAAELLAKLVDHYQ